MRCADCGAINAETADWCSQCYGALAHEQTSPAPPAPAPPPTQPAPGTPSPPASPPAGEEPEEPSAEGFRRRDGTVEWECPACGRWSPAESLRCDACGTTIAGRWQHRAPDRSAVERRFAEPWAAVLGLTAVVPGAGHIGLGLHGPGIARAVLYAVWLAGGVALWRAGGALVGGPLLVGAGLLWAGSLADVAAMRSGGRRELLGARSLLWLVVGVLVLSLLGAFSAAVGGSAAGGTRVG